MKNALILGARGMLGSAIASEFGDAHFDVTRATSQPSIDGFVTITGAIDSSRKAIESLPVFDAVVWAHGINLNDRCDHLDIESLRRVLDVNVVYVASTLSILLNAKKIADCARLAIVSSVWQEVARPGKFSYSISKAALGGLVRVASTELAERGILINAVLPGVLEGPMTRANLSSTQLESVTHSTNFARLANEGDVAKLTLFLCSDSNCSITGQSVVVDLGFSHTKRL